jgi:uncharacterized protein (TIGR02099 family)
MIKKSWQVIQKISIWLVGISLAVMTITALIVQFWFFPSINLYKNTIAKTLSDGLSQTVTIGNISAGWHGLNPSIALDNILVKDAQMRTTITLKKSEIVLSWLSFIAFEPRFADINIEAPNIVIRRLVDGSIWLAGIHINDDTTNPDAMNWLLRQSAFHIHHAKLSWTDELRQAPQLEFSHVNIALTSPPWKKLLKNHEVQITALPNIGTKTPLYLSANVYGNDISALHTWRGALRFAIQNVDLSAFTPWFDYPLNINQGRASLKGNIHFANNQISAMDSSIQLKTLLANLPNTWANQNNVVTEALNNPTSPLAIHSLSADIDWASTAKDKTAKSKQTVFGNSQDYVLSIKHANLSFLQNAESLRGASTKVIMKDGQLKQLEAKFDYANIDALLPHLGLLALDQEIKNNIQASAPSGELSKFNALFTPRKNSTPTYKITTQFKNLAVNATPQNKLGFSGLDGRVRADEIKGTLFLASQSASIELKETLRWPILNNKLQGDISWRMTPNIDQRKPAVIDVSTLAFQIENPHLIGKVNAKYHIDQFHGDEIDMTAQFDKVQAQYALFYYPMSLGEDALYWLDTSILGGEINDIKLLVKGAVNNFPFSKTTKASANSDEILKVSAQLKDGLIDYGKDWPKIEQLNTSLIFEGSRLEMNIISGKMLGNDIIKSRITADKIDADNPIVDVNAEIEGSLPAGIKFINSSPISKVTQGFTHQLVTDGNAKLKLSLKIPLKNVDLATYQGSYTISDGRLQSTSIPTMTHVNGALNFTEKDLNAKNFKVHILGAPVAFKIETLNDKSVHVTAQGIFNETSMSQLKQNINQFITGSTQWIADILIKDEAVNVAIRSDLFGISSNLPPPLNKVASERQSLRIDQKQLATTIQTQVHFNSMLHARTTQTYRQQDKVLSELSVHFGDLNPTNKERLEKAKGINISGELSSFNMDDWIEVYSQLNAPLNHRSSQPTIDLPIARVDLSIDTLEILNKEIHQLSVQHQPGESGIQMHVRSQEVIGDVAWMMQSNSASLANPQVNGKLIARLSHLIIPTSETNTDQLEKKSSTHKKEFVQIKQKYPALDITASNFELGNKKLGSLTLNAYPNSENWVIQKLVLSNADSILNVDGEWNNWVNNPNTRLNVSWDIKNLGNTIKRFGYQDALSEGAGRLSGQLSWSGSPHDFNNRGLNGNINFEFQNGQILKVQPGVGRLLGLLSLQSLPRRLTLDFRDLFNSGFTFDKIKANVTIDDGVLKSDNFTMAGPAADVSIKGEASIPNESQSMLVKVNPRISDSVSLAALAGGPLVGAMAFLAQKILKDPLNKIISTEYMIGGTWDNPIEINENRNKPPAKSQSLQ